MADLESARQPRPHDHIVRRRLPQRREETLLADALRQQGRACVDAPGPGG
jgi:hypothetical protein